MSVAGSASINVEHTNGAGGDAGKTFSMGNQLTFSGSGELDNGLNVALSFVLDQNDDSTTAALPAYTGGPFDSHSVTISSDGLGSLKFSGEGGSSAVSALDGSAAGDIWDSFDVVGSVTPTGLGGGNNSMMYTLPEMMDGVAVNASYTPRTTGTDSSTSWSLAYTGVEGLTASYGMGDGGTTGQAEGTAFKLSYVFGPITAGYSNYEHDTTGTVLDDEITGYQISYTVSDEISVTYGAEEIERGALQDVETMEISAAYTAGGMTLSGSMSEVDNLNGTAAASQDRDRWALGLSFAF
jgi:outer membrane protein OmpU